MRTFDDVLDEVCSVEGRDVYTSRELAARFLGIPGTEITSPQVIEVSHILSNHPRVRRAGGGGLVRWKGSVFPNCAERFWSVRNHDRYPTTGAVSSHLRVFSGTAEEKRRALLLHMEKLRRDLRACEQEFQLYV